MPEPLTSQLLREELQKLIVAFPRNLGAKDPVMMADVYRNGLNGLSGESVRVAVNRVIQDDEYFPKVARLREIATEWSRRTNAVIEQVTRSSDEWKCSVCGAKAEHRKVWRKVVNRTKLESGREKFEEVLGPMTNKDGKPILSGGEPVLGPTWEEVLSPRATMDHDARKHGVFARAETDAA